MPDALTTVAIAWRKNRRNHRLIFGEPVMAVRLDWRRSLSAFKPGQIFAYERWQKSKYGTLSWQVYVCQAGAPDTQVSDIAGIRPGAILLCSGHGKARAKWVLSAIDAAASLQPNILQDVGFWRRLSAFESGRFDSQVAVLAAQL